MWRVKEELESQLIRTVKLHAPLDTVKRMQIVRTQDTKMPFVSYTMLKTCAVTV